MFDPNNEFLVSWEQRFNHSLGLFIDRYNDKLDQGLLRKGGSPHWGLFHTNPQKNGYIVKPISGLRKIWGDFIDLKVKSGKTQRNNLWEYWGYIWIENSNETSGLYLRRVYLNKVKTELVSEDISFPTHKNFLRVGSFTLADVDGDGLDEIVLIEKTGKRVKDGSGESGYGISDVADYVRILKWTGKKYEVVWTSPPIKKQRNKVLVDDVMGNGQKQIIVGTGHGTIQIWEKK